MADLDEEAIREHWDRTNRALVWEMEVKGVVVLDEFRSSGTTLNQLVNLLSTARDSPPVGAMVLLDLAAGDAPVWTPDVDYKALYGWQSLQIGTKPSGSGVFKAEREQLEYLTETYLDFSDSPDMWHARVLCADELISRRRDRGEIGYEDLQMLQNCVDAPLREMIGVVTQSVRALPPPPEEGTPTPIEVTRGPII